jgi:hypothetical protein
LGGKVAVFWEHYNESSDSKRGGKFLDSLSDYYLIHKDSDPRNYAIRLVCINNMAEIFLENVTYTNYTAYGDYFVLRNLLYQETCRRESNCFLILTFASALVFSSAQHSEDLATDKPLAETDDCL